MSTGYYTSDTPVSKRVDLAWGKGYEAGVKDGRNLRHLLQGLGIVYLLLRYGRRIFSVGLVFLPWAIVLAIVALPFVVAGLIVWGLVWVFATIARGAWHNRGNGGRGPSVPAVVTLEDGSTF